MKEVPFSRVLVTGADGFIGSHLVELLVAKGHQVRAFVLYNSFNSWGWLDSLPRAVQDSIEVVAGDVRDYQSVRRAISGCDAVFHLAALIAIPYSYQAPDSYVDTNVRGTLNVLNAVRDLDVGRLIVTSTSEVYGTAQVVPITEDHPLQAQSPYAATKIGADQLALSFHRSFGTPISILRPFNTYGPRQSLRAVIPTIISQIASGQRELRLGDLTPTRDFNYVTDTCEAFLALSECDSAIGTVVNAGSGREISIGELANLIAEVMGKSVEVVADDERVRPSASEVFRLLADSSKIRSLTSWQPSHDLGSGLRKTVEWFTDKNNLDHFNRCNQFNV